MQATGDDLFVGEVLQWDGTSERVFYIDRTGRGHFKNAYESGGFDLAETFVSRDNVEPGMVIEIDPERDGEFRICSVPDSTRVAGVVSTEPAVILGAWGETTSNPKLALAGRVPVKVTAENGPIRPGDLLVSSATAGHAMRANSTPKPGTVIGKSLGCLEDGTGEIELLVMLR
jgi:hypothetical protein